MNEKKTPRVIALGFFDGVHLGHGALLSRTRQAADRLGGEACAVTFDTHPDRLVFGTPVPLINTPEDRAALMRELYGIDRVLTLHFDRAMMDLPWEDFISRVLVERYGASHVVCGHDFHFGRRGEGNPQRLADRCRALGLGCDVIPPVKLDGVVVSSTYIRTLLERGDLEQAARFLGHRHRLSGTVVSGRHLGRTIGIPTANLTLPEGLVRLPYGVYACRAMVPAGAYRAVTNIGVRPTVNGRTPTVESWLLDYEGDLYGQPLRLELCRFLRPEQKFPSLETLRQAILDNARTVRELPEEG